MKIFFGNIPAASGPQNINVLQTTETELAQAISVQKKIVVSQVPQLSVSDSAGFGGSDFEDETFGGLIQYGPTYQDEVNEISTEVVHKGIYSVKLADDNGLNSPVGIGLEYLYQRFTRWYLYIQEPATSLNANVDEGFIWYGGSHGVVGLSTDNNGDLSGIWGCGGNVYSPEVKIKSSVNFGTNKWMCVEVETIYNNPNSGIRVWIDGTLVIEDLGYTWSNSNYNCYIWNGAGFALLGSGTEYLTTYVDSIRYGDTQIGLYPQALTDEAQTITPQLVAGADRIDVTQVTETNTAQSLGKLKSKSIAQITETDSAQAVSAQRRIAIVQITETETAQAVGKQKRITVTQATQTNSSNAVGKKKSLAVLQVSETNSSQAIATSKRVTIAQAVETDSAQAIGKIKYKAVALVTETDTVNSVTSTKRKTVAYVSETDEAFIISSELRVETAFETDIAQSVTAQKLVAIIEAMETDETFAINPTKQIAIAQTTETNTPFALSVQKRKSICPSSSYEIYCATVSGATKYIFFLEKISDNPYYLFEGMDYLDQAGNTALGYKIGESTYPTFSITLPDDGSEYTSGVVVESGVGVYSGMQVQIFNTESIPVIETDTANAISKIKYKAVEQVTETDFADDIFPTVPGLIPVFRSIETDTAFTITALKLVYISAAEETEFAQGLAQILKRTNISFAEETDLAIGISDKAPKYIDITQVAEIDKAFVIRLFNPADVNDETLQVNATVPLSVNVIDSYTIAALCTEFNITTNIYEDTIEVNYETPYLQEHN